VNAKREEGGLAWATRVVFLLFFPGYFFYHVLLGLNVIGPVLAGYANESAAVTIAYFFFTKILFAPQKFSLVGVEKLYVALLGWFALVITVMFVLERNPPVVTNHFASILQMVAVFLLFRHTDFSSRTFRAALGGIFLLMSVLAIVLSRSNYFIEVAGVAQDDIGRRSTYQGFARAFFYAFLVLAGHLERRLYRYVVYVVSLATLLVIGARSEFVAAFIVPIVIEGALGHKRLAMAAGVAALMVFAYVPLADLSDTESTARVHSLFELESDGSVRERSQLLSFAVDEIAGEPIMGDYGGYVVLGGPGAYAHNALSAWVDLGLPGFLLFVGSLLYNASLYLPGSSTKIRHLPSYAVGVCLALVSLFFLATAKTFTDYCSAAAVGLSARLANSSGSPAPEASSDFAAPPAPVA
jgi:hypothetical protein